jgi:hypothetical protein
MNILVTLHGGTVITSRYEDKTNHHVEGDVQIPMLTSGIFCPFIRFIRWLEAVAIGVQECAFGWDAEGRGYGNLKWQENYGGQGLRVGLLTVDWEPIEHRIALDRVQVVGEFYRKFRSFVESENYEPFSYEDMKVAEAVELILENCTLDEFATELASRSADDAGSLMRGLERIERERKNTKRVSLAYCIHVGAQPEPELSGPELEEQLKREKEVEAAFQEALEAEREYWGMDASAQKATETNDEEPDLDEPDRNGWIHRNWDKWDIDRRKTDVLTAIFPSRWGGFSTTNLRKLRSLFVEKWLEEQEAHTLDKQDRIEE